MELINKIPITDCHCCGARDSIVLTTANGKKIKASELLNNKEILERTIFVDMECRRCHNKFELDWTNNDSNYRPEPLLPYKLKRFFE